MAYNVRTNAFPDINGILNTLLSLMIPCIVNGIISWRMGKKWNSKKAILGISFVGLLATGMTMAVISINGIISVFSAIGNVWVLVNPMLTSTNVPHDVVVVFSKFTAFFAITLTVGTLGTIAGIRGIIKLLKKKSVGYSCYG